MSDLTKEHCPEAWERVFGNIETPKIGWTLDEMSNFSRETEKKSLAAMTQEKYEHIMCKNAHDWRSDWNRHLRPRFLEMKSIDKYIASLNEDIVKSFEESRDAGTLCFTQKSDDETVAYVKANPEYTRRGNKIHAVKTPFAIKKLLHETDPKMKRYYSCHCPLIRNSILQEEGPVSRSFCYCSLGYVKKPFDIAFDREISGRVIKTAMDEDGQGCVFELDIPDDLMEQYTFIRVDKLQNTTVKIAYLYDFPEYTGTVLHWLNEEFINKDENDLEYKNMYEWFRHNSKTELPIRLVALTDGECVGTVTLIDNDFPGKSYGPWLGGLFVDAPYRNRGIGRLLLEEGMKIIKDLGYHELYLTTHTANHYYKRFGWQSFEFCKSGEGFDEEIFKFAIND